MQITQKTITTLVAEEGMLLRRKADSWVAGETITLGYNYYEAGVGLVEPTLEKPEDYEEIVKPANYEASPIIDQNKRLTRLAELLDKEKREFKGLGLSAEQMITHRGFALKWGEDIVDGDALGKGEKFTHNGTLYAVLQDHTVMLHYAPADTPALYVEVTPEYTEDGEAFGTLDNPIAYNGNMELEEGKYYSQDGAVYLCVRGSGTPVYHALTALLNIYVEAV